MKPIYICVLSTLVLIGFMGLTALLINQDIETNPARLCAEQGGSFVQDGDPQTFRCEVP